jgi:hypothetical protein
MSLLPGQWCYGKPRRVWLLVWVWLCMTRMRWCTGLMRYLIRVNGGEVLRREKEFIF